MPHVDIAEAEIGGMRGHRRPGLIGVSALWIVAMLVQVAPVVVGSGPSIGSMDVLFWLVVIAASLCVVSSSALLSLGWRRDAAELGVVAGFFLVGSILPLVHGITTPGVIYSDNSATMVSVFLAVPLASAVALPTLVGRSTIGRAILRRWKAWVVMWVGCSLAISATLLARPTWLPAPEPKSALSVAVALAMIAVTIAFAARHLHLAAISRDVRHAAVAVGFAWFGVSAAVWFDGTPLSVGFWTAHLFDIFGVLAATIGGYVAHRVTGSIDDVLRPITNTDPLSALEAGLEPVVHRFVASLDTKDPITRDHVVRTSALAVAVGEELRLPARALRRVGLAALLHDLGKLEIPDAILNKNGPLDDNEFATMRSHPSIGARMVEQSTVIDDIAPLIEAHHERADGAGYPNGLAGDEVPFGASIISVCDAFDAIANTRQYREGAGWQRALDVLAEHSGTQWHPDVVRAATTVIRTNGGGAHPGALDHVGRVGEASSEHESCSCLDAVPPSVARTLQPT